MKALTMFCEPTTPRASALPTFGRVGLAGGCGHGRGAIFEPRASLLKEWNETKKLSKQAPVLFFLEGAADSLSPKLANVFAEIQTSRAALLKSSNCGVFKAPSCLHSPHAESVLSLAANANAQVRTATPVSRVCHSTVGCSSLSSCLPSKC